MASCRAAPSESQIEPDDSSERTKTFIVTVNQHLQQRLGRKLMQLFIISLLPLIKNQPTEIIESNNLTENFAEASETQMDVQGSNENLELTSGSPLPGMKISETVRIPKATIDILKDQVFGFDTFFVTSQEPYEGGVLFRGNLRGKPTNSYEKISKRMLALLCSYLCSFIEMVSTVNQKKPLGLVFFKFHFLRDKFGDEYRLFLLINPEDDRPVAVVVPKQSLQPELTAFDNLGLLKNGIACALAIAFVLGVHEISHILVANSVGLKLGVPYFVPSWQIGSFGAITRILNIVPNREALFKFAAAGPIAGFLAGLVLLLLGFILPPIDGVGIVIDPIIFHESFLAGGIAKLILGDILKEGTTIAINPFVLWAWSGLLINAINSILAGELDGGRISFALWGRKASARIT